MKEKIGRNETCPCGSGKKHKHCCLKKGVKEVFQLNNATSHGAIPKTVNMDHVMVLSHDFMEGSRALALANLEQLLLHLTEEVVSDRNVRFLSKDILELAQNEEKHYYQTVTEVLELQHWPSMSIREEIKQMKARGVHTQLHYGEKVLLYEVMSSISGEYATISSFQKPDYDAMRVLTTFCYEVLEAKMPKNQVPKSVVLYVDTGDTLINWNIAYVPYAEKNTLEPGKHSVFIDWHALDKLEQEYKIIENEFAFGLEEKSKKMLATALYQEKQLKKENSSALFSYTGIAMTYFGVIEREFRAIIGKVEKWTKPKKIMWNDICKYYETHNLPILSDHKELLLSMKGLNTRRNEAAHGEWIEEAVFQEIKELAISKQLLYYISLAKNHLER